MAKRHKRRVSAAQTTNNVVQFHLHHAVEKDPKRTQFDRDSRIKQEAANALARNLARENSRGAYRSTQDYRASLTETRAQRDHLLQALSAAIRSERAPGECVETTYTSANAAAEWRKKTHQQRLFRIVEQRVLTGRVGIYRGGKYREDYDGPREGVDWGMRMRADWWQQSTLWVQGAHNVGFVRDDDDLAMHSVYPAVEYRAILNVKQAAERVENGRIAAQQSALARAAVIEVDFGATAVIAGVLPEAA